MPPRSDFEFSFEKNTVHCFRAASQGAIIINILDSCLSRTVTVMLFPHMQGILELGAGILGVKTFLVDGVVCVELNH